MTSSYRMSLPEIEQLLSKIDTGTLLDGLDRETQVAVFEQRYIRQPIVMPSINSQLAVLNHLFSKVMYDSYTGEWVYVRHVQAYKPGDKAGSVPQGKYRELRIFDSNWRATQLIALFTTGSRTSKGEVVDHLNGITYDDRLENLRRTSQAINRKNSAMRLDNKTAYTGVWFDEDRNKYQSYIRVSGKQINLGRFDTAIEAHEAREAYLAAHPELGYTARHGK